MDESPNEASGQNAPIGPTALPDGWRYADSEPWIDPYRSARRRKLALLAALVVIVAAGLFALAVWDASADYARGVYALRIHEYSWAADEFSAAHILGIPYRNARSLERQARLGEEADAIRIKQAASRQAVVVAQLRKADAGLKAGDVDTVLTALRGIDHADLQATLGGDAMVRGSVRALAADLADASRTALRNGAWGRATRLAAALLLLQPSSKPAVSLEAKAKTGQDMSAKLASARDAARHRKWKRALRLGLAIVAAQKDFPGAKALVAEARRALAPKHKSAATATTTPARATTPPATPPATQPAPP
jgi:hypothetical protein